MKIKFLTIIISLSTLLACSAQKAKMTTPKTEKSQTITLKHGELFVAVVGFQMAGKEQLLEEYFGIVFPPAQKFGFTPLGQLPIDKVASGNFMPNEFVGLFKWPDMAGIEGFLGEVSPDQLAQLRVKIWTELKQCMMMVPMDLELTFKENKVYEVILVWNTNTSDSDKISRQGGTVLLNSPVAGYEDLNEGTSPNHLMIIEWPNKQSATSFRKKNQLQFEKEEAFYTHFAFPEEK